MAKLLISNARLVNEGEIRAVDVLVDGQRIARIDSQIGAAADVEVIDAKGRYLMPGMIDDQVHFRQPGLTAKADMATESAAAAAGGSEFRVEACRGRTPGHSLGNRKRQRKPGGGEHERAPCGRYPAHIWRQELVNGLRLWSEQDVERKNMFWKEPARHTEM